MKSTRKKQIIRTIESTLENLRRINRELKEETGLQMDDPVSDVRLIEKEDHILMTYDGVGYDWFSYNCAYKETRNSLFNKLEKAGFLVEDRNNWSLTIREE